jgi:hypothetical protein
VVAKRLLVRQASNFDPGLPRLCRLFATVWILSGCIQILHTGLFQSKAKYNAISLSVGSNTVCILNVARERRLEAARIRELMQMPRKCGGLIPGHWKTGGSSKMHTQRRVEGGDGK